MACKVLSIPKNTRISRSVFCDVCILTRISSAKDESSIGCFHLRLVADLKVCTNGGGVSSMPGKKLI